MDAKSTNIQLSSKLFAILNGVVRNLGSHQTSLSAKPSPPSRSPKSTHSAEKSYTGASLIGADLRGVDLQGAQLDGANLSVAKLDGANLRGAHLGGALLRGASLTGTDLRGANLHNALLYWAQFDSATLLPDGTHWSPDVDWSKFGAQVTPPAWWPKD